MSLIVCPECGEKISDKADICVHCGYPIKSLKNICVINGKECDLSFILDDEYSIIFKVRDFIQLTNCEIGKSRELVEKIICDGSIPKSLYIPIEREQAKPKCPTCGSTNIKKISGTKKAASIIGFGILSSNLGKTYECLNCKYKW